MTAISLRAPWDARRSRKNAQQYADTHSALVNETEETRFDRECVLAVDIALSITDFSEVHHGTA